jgi:hypothetical protein
MSSLYLDIKYARIVGQRLDRWKIRKENPFHLNARCPICGDSATNKNKARFHIIQKNDTLFCRCFNCDYSTNLFSFLKVYHSDIFSEYTFEKYRVTDSAPVITSKHIVETAKTPQIAVNSLDLQLVSGLDINHPVRSYVTSRNLPDYPFMYVEKFFEFSKQYNDDLVNYTKDEPRLIIPFYDRNNNIFAYQGRDLLGKSNQKYITIIINKKIPKIFGIGNINFQKPVTIVEGPIDSLFLDNSLASVNASLVSTANRILPYINKGLITICLDNEPRNKQIVKLYQESIDQGYNTVIWPTSPDKKEDINDLVLMGKDPKKIINANTYSGLQAQLQFQRWKKI